MKHNHVQAGGQHFAPKHNRKKSRFPLGIFLGYLFLITLMLTNITISRYISKHTAGDGARVAVMASKASITVEPMVGHPGDADLIPISVTNKDGDRVCEVAQSYSVEVRNLTGNLPLEFAFYEDQACSTPVTGMPSGTFAAGTEASEQFWLRVTWPETQNNPELAFALDACEITVLAEQID